MFHRIIFVKVAGFMKKLLIFVLVALLLAGCGTQAVTPTDAPAIQESTIPEETLTTTVEETTTEATIPPVDGVDGETLYNEDQFALVFQGISEAKLP